MGPAELAYHRDACRRLFNRKSAHLAPREKQVFKMWVVEGMSRRRIAYALGLTVDYVKQTLRDARRKMVELSAAEDGRRTPVV